MSRISAMFERLRTEGHTGLIAYTTTGFPSVEATAPIVSALIDGGADAVELSLPFSDPLADGATVQRSTFAALERGVTPPDVL
ncbi:MAG: tryptophan synthase subunit alpha, partial [Dehalococcoidia bacterium]